VLVKRIVYLAIAALVAMMILMPTAMGQATKMEETKMMEKTMEGLPKSGGPAVTTVLVPAAALLLGSGILGYTVLRRRR
jgi:hypothetical protein